MTILRVFAIIDIRKHDRRNNSLKKIEPIKPVLSPAEDSDFYLEDEQLFENIYAKNLDYSYLTCKNLIIRDAQLERVTMHKTRLERFECSNVLFKNCDFSNLEWLGASFHQVWFDQCKLIGTNFAESYLRDSTFSNCVATFASFSNTNLKAVKFTDNQLADSEFYEVVWKQLFVENNELTGSNWFRTPLNKLDLTTNTFTKIALSQENLKGLIVNQEQALTIAAGLGLVIE